MGRRVLVGAGSIAVLAVGNPPTGAYVRYRNPLEGCWVPSLCMTAAGPENGWIVKLSFPGFDFRIGTIKTQSLLQYSASNFSSRHGSNL